MKNTEMGLLLFCLALLLVSCDIGINDKPATSVPPFVREYSDDTVAVADLDWPQRVPGRPSCSDSTQKTFEMPDVAEPSGDIVITPSAYLQPVGVIEKMRLRLQSSGSEPRDGVLKIDAGNGAVILDSGSLGSVNAALSVRFDTQGSHTITAVFAAASDTLRGTVTIAAYAPQLPIVEMTVDEDDYGSILDDPYENISVPAQFTYDGNRYSCTVRLHGGSSRDYPKKSFRFDLSDSKELPDGCDHIILRAEWNDKTMLRNYLCCELARQGLWIPVPKAEMVHFRINSRYYGVMWRVERIDGDFLGARGLNSTIASLYEADPDPECFVPGGDMTPLASDDVYRCVYAQQKGNLDYKDLKALIEETLLLPDDEFKRTINDVVRVNDMLAYFAFMAVVQNHDHIRKNYYLYRDPHADDDRWTIVPWDLELTLGHLWTETDDVLDENIFTDEPLDFGAVTPPLNALFVRLYAIDSYRRRFDGMVGHLTGTVFTGSFVDERIDEVLCGAAPDILADGNKRADNSEYLARVDEVRRFVEDRRRYIASVLK